MLVYRRIDSWDGQDVPDSWFTLSDDELLGVGLAFSRMDDGLWPVMEVRPFVSGGVLFDVPGPDPRAFIVEEQRGVVRGAVDIWRVAIGSSDSSFLRLYLVRFVGLATRMDAFTYHLP